MSSPSAQSGRHGRSSPAKALLAVEILATCVRVRFGLSRQDLPSVVASLRADIDDVEIRSRHRLGHDEIRLGSAVVKTLGLAPFGSRCLTRSLVLVGLLARRDIHGSLVIAAQPGGGVSLDAHAWVEVDGRPLLAPAPEFGRLVVL
jgi:hypothetical protein